MRTTQPLSGVSTPSLPVQTAQSSIPVVKQSMYTVSSLEAAVLPPSLPKATIATPIRLPSSSLRSYAPTPYDYMAYHSHLHPAAALSDLVHSQWPSRSPPRTVAEYSRLPSSLVKDLHVPKRSPPPPPKRAGVDAGTQCGQDAETQTPIPLSLQQSTFPNANIPPVTTPIPVQVMETPMRAASPPKRPPPPVLDDSMPAPEMGENFNVIWPAWPRTPISPKQTHQSQPGSPLPLSLQRPVRESARMHREVQSAARSQRLATLRERLENVSAQVRLSLVNKHLLKKGHHFLRVTWFAVVKYRIANICIDRDASQGGAGAPVRPMIQSM